jgi:cell division protein FtsB
VASNTELEDKLNSLLQELKTVMRSRQERIAALRAEIEAIERQNESLETTIAELLKAF